MKKILLVLVAMVATSVMFAQTRFGVKGGALLSSWNVKVGGEKEEDYKTKFGFQAGFVADFAISESFSIQPNLLFVNKGSAEKHEDHTDKIHVTAIDIPVNFLYKAKSDAGTFFVGGGPNFGFNLSAKLKSEEHEDEKMEIGNEAGQLRGFDFGLNALIGYEFKNGFFVSGNFTPGIANLGNNVGNVEVKARSTYFGLSAGFMFGGGKTKEKGK
jgi:hypothetical protein